MGYKTEQLQSGALLVRDVHLQGPQKLNDPGDKFEVKATDRKWMEKAVENFRANKAKGKLPYLWDRHNSKDNPAKVIGRLDNLRVQDHEGAPWLLADVIITSDEHQTKFLRGDYPSKSTEFMPDTYYLRGLALLDGHEGRFDREIPDFVPEGLYDELVMLGADTSKTVFCYSPAVAAMGEETMDIEQFKAAMGEMLKPLVERIEKVEATKANKATGDIDADLQAIREQERANAEVKLAKIKRNAKIDAYTAQLNAKTKTPESLLRKKLDSFQTDEGMDEWFKASMKNAEDDVRLGVEREHGDQPDLEEEYKNFKASYPDTKVSLAQYKSLANYQPKNYRNEGRTVISVRDGIGEFVNA